MADIAFNIDPEVIIGSDVINRAGTICKAYGNRVLVVAESNLREDSAVGRLIAVLKDSGVEAILFDEVSNLAMADTAEAAATLARAAHCSMVIGFGNFVTQSIARMVALSANATFDIFELLDGKIPQSVFLPYIAIPSIKEDPFLLSDGIVAVDPRNRAMKLVKVPKGLCKALIVDSGFSETGSVFVSAFDGFCIALESYCSKKSNFLSEPLLEKAIVSYAHLMSATNCPVDEPARAGFLAGLGAAISSVGIGSALAYSIARRFPVSKSACAAVLLPAIMEKLESTRPEKMAKVAALMGEKTEGLSVADAAACPLAMVRRSLENLNISVHLRDLGLEIDRLVPIAEAVRELDFVSFSPWTVTSEEILDIIKKSF